MEPTVGIDLTGWGAVFLGVAALIGSLVSGYTAVKNTKKITQIDNAVNGKKPGAQTMVDQVDDLHSDRPKPPELPPELNNAAIRDLLRYVAAEVHDRRKKEGG